MTMMIENNLFWLLVCGHLIGDFYLQTEEMANGKKEERNILYKHALIYALVLLVAISPVLNSDMFIYVYLPVVISHFFIDLLKVKIQFKRNSESFITRNIFLVDQIAHIAIVIIFACIYANDSTIALNQFGQNLLSFYQTLGMIMTSSILLRIVFVFLLIGKPGNIIIREINNKEKIRGNIMTNGTDTGKEGIEETEYKNAGKLIGILERILVVILVMLNQYAAVGIIFAAKSLTRYDKIVKDPSFAEYYLVGTLLSLLIAIAAVLSIQPI